MKKLISLILALALVFALAACTKAENDASPDITNPSTVKDSPLDVLTKAWDKVPEDNRFPISGGDSGEILPAPGEIKDLNNVIYSQHLPEAEISNLDSAATMTHMMNANNFSSAAYKLKSADYVSTFAKNMRDALKSTQWMCGFPEELYIAKVGSSIVVVIFGHKDMTVPVEKALSDIYGSNISVLYNEEI